MSVYTPGGSGKSPNPFGSGDGAVKFRNTGGAGKTSGVGSVYKPTASGGGSGAPGGALDGSEVKPGVISINPLDPLESAQQAGAASQGMFDGLASALFGPKTGILTGGLTGAIAEGTDPVSGLLRGAGGIPGGIGDTLKNAADVVGGGLERLPAGIGVETSQSVLDKEYAATEADPEFQKWLDQKGEDGKTNREKYAGDKGIAGTGILGNEAHMKSAAMRDYAKAMNYKDPSLMPGAFKVPGSMADNLTNMMDGLGLIGTGWQRGLLGVKGVGDAEAIGSGKAVSTGFLGTGLAAGSKEATPAEQLVAKKLSDGSWTEDQAMDFLVASGNTAHDSTLSLALAVASPDIALGFGMAGLAKAGVKGGQVVAGVEKGATLLADAKTALTVAEKAADAAKLTRAGKAAIKAGETTRTMRAADKAVEAAKVTVGEREAAVQALKGYRTGDDIRKVNVVDRAFQGSERAQRLVTAFGRTYTGLEGTYLGRAAKVSRYLIDPMHGIDLHRPGVARMVDLYSDTLTETLHVTANPIEGLKNFELMRGIDNTGALADRYARALATGMTNRGRDLLLRQHQVSAIDRGLAGALQTADSAFLRKDVIADVAKHTKEKDLLAMLRQDITENVLRQDEYWTEAAHKEMAAKLESVFGLKSAEEWMAELPAMSKERKSLLDFALYAESNKTLLDELSIAKVDPRMIGEFGVDMMDRLVLLRKDTLTQVNASSLLSKLGKLKSDKAKLGAIRAAQEKWPQLRYITMDDANAGKSVERFAAWVEDNMESFPMQLKNEELGKMTDGLRNLSDNLGSGYKLGFRPKDEFLWGIERSNEKGGGFIARTAPWSDHVAEGGRGYRPGLDLPRNIAGMPIVGRAVRGVVKPVDYMYAGAQMFTAQVTGAQVHEVARARFIGKATTSAYKDAGLTEQVASKWWDRLQKYTREHQGYSGPRGFGKGDLYKAIADEGLIPTTMLNGATRLTEHDVLKFVLEAYDGDMRFIGLTQKLSGRVKKYVSAATGYNTNFAGQIAEHAWPLLKFRYNPIFQVQEKIEPWVLNTARGITSPFFKPNLSAADKATEGLLTRMTDSSLIRQADLDQAEYVQLLNFDRQMKTLSSDPTKRMHRIAGAAGQIMDVQGVKRIGALRTFRKGLGKEIRGAWDEVMPGHFDDMKSTADGMAGRILDEDEFAVQLLNENLFANDIVMGRLGKAGRAAGLKPVGEEVWGNAIKTGEWTRPMHIGELRGLDLDHVAKGMQSFGDGQKVANLADMRRIIASADKPAAKIEEVSDFLRRLGADKDYVSRVENSLTFSWTGFWKEAGKRYNLTNDESVRLQDFMANAAGLRGMNPVDFMSQVFNPGIIDGTEGLLGSLDAPLGMLRKNKSGQTVGRGRSQLAAPVGGAATREDLVRQMSAVMSQHLDPSAKRALLMEFRPELKKSMLKGDVKFNKKELAELWDSDAESLLADRILGYMDGAYGENAYDALTDATRGNANIRAGADKYLRDRGVTPQDEARYYQHDVAEYEADAAHYRDLPEIEYEKTGRRPTTKALYEADTDLKPQPAGVDDRTYKAYEQFVHETKEQFEFMTRPKAQGGMGIKVTVAKGDPYTTDAAGRAAMQADLKKGRIRVLGQSSDHPIMTNEQNVMFRAVHDVFGHGGENFEFGPRGELNAAASHFKMYGPDARGPLLTETHGQTAYVNFSDDVIEGTAVPRKPLDAADPSADWEARHPFEGEVLGSKGDPDAITTDTRTVQLVGDDRVPFEYTYTRGAGAGLRALPPELQRALLQPLQDVMDDFPGLKVHHVDVIDFEGPLNAMDDDLLEGLGTKSSPFAVTFGADDDGPVILFNSKYANDQYWVDDWMDLHKRNELMKEYPTFYKPSGVDAKGNTVFKDLPRESNKGAAHNAVAPGEQFSLAQVMRHEAGHAFDVARRPRVATAKGWTRTPIAGYQDYHDMMVRFEKAAGRLDLSEYGMKSGEEFAAELFAVATNPDLDMAQVLKQTPELHAMVDEFQTYLKQVGEWKPATVNPNAGKTVREVNAAKRGTVYAPQKAGILPQERIDDFARRYVGKGKHVESNPDVARVAQHFGAFSQKVLANGIMQGDNAVHAGLLQDIAKMPIENAAPYNYTEAMAHQLAVQNMQAKWSDAYRLQYFAQSRTMLERSINHPMFGLYPASYMWGKIMPEVVQFIAQRPFGLRTGGMLSAMTDVKSQIALRREFDPEFDAAIEKLGHSQVMSFVGYMLPTTPWDVTASFPQWMKDIAAQGTNQAEAVAAGQRPEDLNLVQPAVDTVGKLNPLETTIPWAGRAFDELNGPNTEKEQLQAALEKAQVGQVQAGELGTPLWYVMNELRAELSK